jgi:conjugative transfer signal peptidase TraF
MRRTAIGLLVVFALMCLALAFGVRYNGTPSFPAGFYMVSGKHAVKGDLVLVSLRALPALPAFEIAKERGYLNVAYTPVEKIMKRIVGVSGDRVTIDSAGVEVNGIRLKNSAPLKFDAAGRPMILYPLKDYVLGTDEVLLMSDYNPASFDSRYFGPLHSTTIESVVRPLLTWN